MKQLHRPEMPYERFEAGGKAALSNAELLAVLLRTGTAREPVLELSRHLLRLKGGDGNSLSILYNLSQEDLQRVPGIGRVRAIQIQCLLELSRRLACEAAHPFGQRLTCSQPQIVANYYMESLRHEAQERVIALFLDNRLCLLREEILTIGTADASLCSPRDVFRRALDAGAVSFLLLHNHPSGDPSPSKEDVQLTKRLKEAGELMEIRLVDHIIIGDRRYCSLMTEKMM